MRLFVLTLLAAVLANASPIERTQQATCAQKTQRKAWHTLTNDEKHAYIAAEKCLMSTPARLNFSSVARTIFDELQLFHVFQTPDVHFVGAFLPFHRYFMQAHEHLLKTVCNYTGGQPYWEEAMDAGNFTKSVVLDPVTGFGGDGAGALSCVKDGPFKDYVNVIGPGQANSEHCIDRQLNDCFSLTGTKKIVDGCMQMQNFSTFWPCIEGGPHGAGHGAVGGEMLNLFSSPGDPLFYLHHTYLDKLWADWQAKNRSARLTDITGTNKPLPIPFFPGPGFNGTFPPLGNGTFPPGFNGTFPGAPPGFNGSFPGAPPGFNGSFPGFPPGSNVTFPPPAGGDLGCFMFPGFPGPPGTASMSSESVGDPGDVTTLGHVLSMYGVIPNATIGDVMDIQGGTLCYEYL